MWYLAVLNFERMSERIEASSIGLKIEAHKDVVSGVSAPLCQLAKGDCSTVTIPVVIQNVLGNTQFPKGGIKQRCPVGCNQLIWFEISILGHLYKILIAMNFVRFQK